MNLVTLHSNAIWLFAVAAVVGCGSSTATNPGNGGGNPFGSSGYDATASSGGGSNGGSASGSSSGGGYDPTPSSSSSGSGSSSGGGGTVCVTSCTANGDCQNSCPAAASGSSNCCDTASGTCFVTQMAACPAQVVGAAE